MAQVDRGAGFYGLLLRQAASGFALLSGLTFAVVGGVLFGVHRPETASDLWATVGTVLIAIGASLMAAGGYAFLTAPRRDFVERLRGLGFEDTFPNRFRRFEGEHWERLLSSARHSYKVLGIANHGYLRNEAQWATSCAAFTEALQQRSIEMEFLWLDPESRFAEARAQEERRETRRDILAALVRFLEFRDGLQPDAQARLSLKVYNDLPTCGITLADDLLIVSHYIRAHEDKFSPGMVLRNATAGTEIGLETKPIPSLTRTYLENYVQIAGQARNVGAEDLPQFREQLAEYLERGAKSEADLE